MGNKDEKIKNKEHESLTAILPQNVRGEKGTEEEKKNERDLSLGIAMFFFIFLPSICLFVLGVLAPPPGRSRDPPALVEASAKGITSQLRISNLWD